MNLQPDNSPSTEASSQPVQLLEIEEFEPAFPVTVNRREETLRRFSPLLVDSTGPRLYGANGMVSHAFNAFGESFAIKRLRNGLEGTPLPQVPPALASHGSILAFRDEYENQLAVAGLKGFPQLYGYGKAEGAPVIIMEWIEGVNLEAVREQLGTEGRLDPQTVAALGASLFVVLASLDCLASRPVHRDLSPRNIMVRTTQRSLAQQQASGSFDLCIIDFGSTTVIDRVEPGFTATTAILRHATPEYGAPEMLADTLPDILTLRQSPSIDVYAACSMLYELLEGHTPFRLTEQGMQHPWEIKTSTTPAPLHCPGYERLTQAIEAGLSVDQEKRPSAAQMEAVCREALGQDVADAALATPASPIAGAEQAVAANAAQPPLTVLPQNAGGITITDASSHRAAESQKRGLTRRSVVTMAAVGVLALGLGGIGAVLGLQARDRQTPEETEGPESTQQTQEEVINPVAYSGGSLYAAQEVTTELWGFLNAQRQWVIAPQFRSAGMFSEDLALVQDTQSELWGYVDASGEWAIEPVFPSAAMFKEGLAFVQSSQAHGDDPIDGIYYGGFIDNSGQWAIPPRFVGGSVFNQGLCSVTTQVGSDRQWGFIDSTGTMVIPEQFYDPGSFAENLCNARASSHLLHAGWIGLDGTWAIEPVADRVRAGQFNDGVASFQDLWSNHWGYVDSTGAVVLEPQFEEAFKFVNGLAAAKDTQTHLYGFIDRNGQWNVSPRFPTLGSFYHGLAAAQDAETSLFGYVDDTGEWVIPPSYAQVYLNPSE